MHEVPVEAAGGGQRPRRRPGVVIAEPVDRDDIVVNRRAVRAERVGCRGERDQPSGGPGSAATVVSVGLSTATRLYTAT